MNISSFENSKRDAVDNFLGKVNSLGGGNLDNRFRIVDFGDYFVVFKGRFAPFEYFPEKEPEAASRHHIKLGLVILILPR